MTSFLSNVPTIDSTLEATQWQILSQYPTYATRFWWHLYWSWLNKLSICPWVACEVGVSGFGFEGRRTAARPPPWNPKPAGKISFLQSRQCMCSEEGVPRPALRPAPGHEPLAVGLHGRRAAHGVHGPPAGAVPRGLGLWRMLIIIYYTDASRSLRLFTTQMPYCY